MGPEPPPAPPAKAGLRQGTKSGLSGKTASVLNLLDTEKLNQGLLVFLG